MNCGTSRSGDFDGGFDVTGEPQEYGVYFRVPRNPYCRQLEASQVPVVTGGFWTLLCRWDAPARTACPEQPLNHCTPVEQLSPDLLDYTRNNRVPQICAGAGATYETCNAPQPGGCTDGTFCVRVRRMGELGPVDICVPYPCNP